MDGFNMLSMKLRQCRNCFSIAQNDLYVAAVGDQIVIYQKKDLGVQCVITSKVFSHPCSLRFLSDHTFIVKNNYAQYMVYDVLKKEILWKIKPRGYDSIDTSLIVSSEGIIYDILTHHNYNKCCTQLAISLQSQQFEIRDLSETAIPIEGWTNKGSACSRIQFYNGNNQKMYLLKGYVISQKPLETYTVEYVLFHKDLDKHSIWTPLKRWRFDKPIKFKTNYAGNVIVRDEVRKPIYFDEQYIVWNDYICENWQTGEQCCLDEQDKLSTPSYIKRISDSEHNVDVWFVHGGNTTQIRQYKTWERVPLFHDVENWNNERICDIDIFPPNGKLLIGTMSGLFLCEFN